MMKGPVYRMPGQVLLLLYVGGTVDEKKEWLNNHLCTMRELQTLQSELRAARARANTLPSMNLAPRVSSGGTVSDPTANKAARVLELEEELARLNEQYQTEALEIFATLNVDMPLNRYRAVIMKYLKGFDTRQIAMQLGVTEQSARKFVREGVAAMALPARLQHPDNGAGGVPPSGI